MAEPLTVRLFVRTQTYDIPCNSQQPAKWLLMQAKNIDRTNRKQSSNPQEHPEDELEVLYNRTTRQVIDLSESIGKVVSPMDVIDARTLLQTPDTTFNSAMFPWLRSYPGGLALSQDTINSSNGLFFQQLYAFTLIGKRTPVPAAKRKEKQNQEAFLTLLESYVLGSYENNSRLSTKKASSYQQPLRNSVPPRLPVQQMQQEPQRRYSGPLPTTTTTSSPYPTIQQNTTERDVLNTFSDSGSDNTGDDDESSPVPLRMSATEYGVPQGKTVPVVPSPSVRRVSNENPLNDMDNVFDIVFKQQAIGMKLGADETKQFAVVKECFEGSEAKRYPEIQSGVVILAVNGQEVSGLGLSRVLYRLREAPRPVVVRFGRMSTRQLQEQKRIGTWG